MKFLLLLLSLPLSGQIHVTFSQGGAESIKSASGKRIPGVGIVFVTAVNHGPARVVQAQEIYGLAAHLGIAAIGPNVAAAMLGQTAARSPWRVAADVITIGSGIAALPAIVSLTGKSPIMNKYWTAGFAALPVVEPLALKFAQDQQPAVSVAVEGLLQGSYQIATGGALPDGRMMLVRFQGNWGPREGDLP